LLSTYVPTYWFQKGNKERVADQLLAGQETKIKSEVMMMMMMMMMKLVKA
jgi:hypothetical protein